MPGWLSTAAKVFRRQASEPPQVFQVRCRCGQTYSGERTRKAQSLVCPACNTRLFVLPASVYPRPKLAAKKPAGGPAGSRAAQRETLTNTGPGSRTRQRRAARTGAKERSPGDAIDAAPAVAGATETATAEPGMAERVRRAWTDFDFARWRRKAFSPLRLVLLGVVAVVAATAWWLIHLHNLEQAREVLASTPRLAEQALEEGDLAEAARRFVALRDAVDMLGRYDRQAEVWRRSAEETVAAAELIPVSLHDIVAEAASVSARATGPSWSTTFSSSYRDGWVVIDAPVSRSAEAGVDPRYSVDYPIYAGQVQGTIRAELGAFDGVVKPGEAPRRVIFAAQLEDCLPEPGIENTWRIVLRPASGFLWTSEELYETLGLPGDESTRQVLDAQAQRLDAAP